mgnify:CR=1 FL=1
MTNNNSGETVLKDVSWMNEGLFSAGDKSEKKEKKCGAKTEVYSRVVGFYRPIEQWNEGKKEEFKDRKTYVVD